MRQSLKKILLAVDGSEASLDVVRYVGKVLPGDRTKITLFHVMNWIPESFWDFQTDPGIRRKLREFRTYKSHQEEIIEEFMEQAGTLLSEAGYPAKHVLTRVRERHVGVARDIVHEAEKGYAALVLGRRGMGPLKNLVLGSTATKLVHHISRIPVWVVGENPDSDRILIAMDRSDCAMRTLDYVTNYLGLLHKDLFLFHAVRRLESPRVRQPNTSSQAKVLEWFDKVRSETVSCEKEIMQSLFERRIQSLKQLGVDASRIRTKIVTGVSSRAGAVLEEAEKQDCGTIVLGRKGLSVVQEFLLGRVCGKVLEMARKRAVWVVN